MHVPDARVLVVEDEAGYRQDLVEFLALKRPNWVVDQAVNENEGMNVVQSRLASGEPIGIVITDLVMGPNLQAGLHLLKAARGQDELIQVILYSRKPKKLDRFIAFTIGAFEVIDIGKQRLRA